MRPTTTKISVIKHGRVDTDGRIDKQNRPFTPEFHSFFKDSNDLTL